MNGWTACGTTGTRVVGRSAGNWSFGAIGTATATGFLLRSVVIGAQDQALVAALRHLHPETIRKTSTNGDTVDLATWSRSVEPLPVVAGPDGKATLPAIMLSPLAVSVRGQKGRWHRNLAKMGTDLEDAVNFRLSRLVGRSATLTVQPDKLYLRANPRHSTMVRTRSVRGGRPAFVIGMLCPLSITGRISDLEAAWALGIGEKNRYGFGCIGYAGRNR